MRLMRRTKQGLTAAAVLALISGGGVAVLTNNAMTRQIDQMAAKHGIDLNTAETGQMLTNTFKSSYAKACGVLSQFGIVPEDIAKRQQKKRQIFRQICITRCLTGRTCRIRYRTLLATWRTKAKSKNRCRILRTWC